MTTEDKSQAKWSVAEWHDRVVVDCNGEKIGKLQDVYVHVETDEPQFGTVKDHFERNYTPPSTESGHRLARR